MLENQKCSSKNVVGDNIFESQERSSNKQEIVLGNKAGSSNNVGTMSEIQIRSSSKQEIILANEECNCQIAFSRELNCNRFMLEDLRTLDFLILFKYHVRLYCTKLESFRFPRPATPARPLRPARPATGRTPRRAGKTRKARRQDTSYRGLPELQDAACLTFPFALALLLATKTEDLGDLQGHPCGCLQNGAKPYSSCITV